LQNAISTANQGPRREKMNTKNRGRKSRVRVHLSLCSCTTIPVFFNLFFLFMHSVRTALPTRFQPSSRGSEAAEQVEAARRSQQVIGGGQRGQPSSAASRPPPPEARAKIASYESAPSFLGQRAASSELSAGEAAPVTAERKPRPARPLLFAKPKIGL